MKRLFIIVLFMVSICFPFSAHAAIYLNGDPNFPMTAGHGDYYEYIDLSSCQIVNETDQYYELSSGYIIESVPVKENPYRTRLFRYWKDGFTRPQFYSPYQDAWIDIPVQNKAEIEAFRKQTNYSYSAYWQKYMPNTFAMLNVVLMQLFGVDLPE